MEKLKSGDDEAGNECNSDTATSCGKVNNNPDNYKSIVTRSGFRTSTLAKRARVSLTTSKSDKSPNNQPNRQKLCKKSTVIEVNRDNEDGEKSTFDTPVKKESTEVEESDEQPIASPPKSHPEESVVITGEQSKELTRTEEDGLTETRTSNSPVQQQQQQPTRMKSEKKKKSSSSPITVESCNPGNIGLHSHPPSSRQGKLSKGGSSGTKEGSTVEKQKLAPMLLMNLPYMGELTFDTRPRRGRKPKKADICHLISKNYGSENLQRQLRAQGSTQNYGIQFPNSYVNIPISSPPTPQIPPPSSSSTTIGGVTTKNVKNKGSSSVRNISLRSNSDLNNGSAPVSSTLASGPNFIPGINWNQLPPDLLPLASLNPSVFLYPKTSVVLSNKKKISSRFHQLEQYQEQQQQQQQFQFPKHFLQQQQQQSNDSSSDEPLNLCVRDEDSAVSLQMASSRLNFNNQINQPTTTKPSATNLFNNFNLKRCTSNSGGGSGHLSRVGGGNRGGGGGDRDKHPANINPAVLVSDDPSLVNINLEQLNLSASKLANYVNSANNNRPLTTSTDHCGPPVNLLPPPLLSGGKSRRKRTTARSSTLNNSGNLPGSHNHSNQKVNHNHHGPSMDTRNSPFASPSHNPAEVSICKFKFTGGAKPSLQEKKMLSVDSTGNFRFYSDKACTSSSSSKNTHPGGVKEEFSHCGGELLSAQGLPKSAKSMSMCMPMSTMSSCSVLSDLHSPSLPCSVTSPSELDCSSSSDGASSSMASPPGRSGGPRELSTTDKMTMKRKRRTRKSLMREKLEKTFKEKGFLIQTQQLESAEGATYCKFRQLRKFTRYLFRSWKDYLPDNLKAINPAPGQHGVTTESSSPLHDLQPSSSDLFSESMDKDMDETWSDTPENTSSSPPPNQEEDAEDDLD